MHSLKVLLLAATAAYASVAAAAVTPEEAKKLGTTLTPFGAEIAGNKDGTIPAYTGGLTKPPAGYKKGIYTDPFPEEKPLFRIDASNWEKYKDKLTPGTVELIKKYPKTFFIDIYPTHRTAAYTKEYLENSVKNATRCTLNAEGTGIDTSKGCGGGALFPIPKTGLEVLWNKLAATYGPGILKTDMYEYIKPSGEVVNTAVAAHLHSRPIADPNNQLPDPPLVAVRVEYKGPTRLAGNASLIVDSPKDSSRRAYSYVASTRRVRLAPDLAADTPISASGGVQLYDDDSLFSGSPERFEWKLIGKEERYIPYNNYRMAFPGANSNCNAKELLTPNHWRADCMRWELHRVWHITATLKGGKRHVYSKRDLFIDEDTLTTGIAENYDQAGKLYKFVPAAATPMYDVLIPTFYDQIFLDAVSGVWAMARTEQGATWSIFRPQQAMLAPDSTTGFMLKE